VAAQDALHRHRSHPYVPLLRNPLTAVSLFAPLLTNVSAVFIPQLTRCQASFDPSVVATSDTTGGGIHQAASAGGTAQGY
jgi:hypothetical protein